MAEDQEKYVDESWKESAEQEKETLKNVAGGPGEAKAQPAQEPESAAAQEPQNAGAQEQLDDLAVHFLNYVASLGYQAMIFMGEVPNPVTNEKQVHMEQAKFLVDTLAMLQQKTKGNLAKQEEDMLNSTVYELQMKYVEVSKREAEEPKEEGKEEGG